MRVLLVGYSNIAVRKILPAMDNLGFERIDIATCRPHDVQFEHFRTPVNVLSGYEEGIRESDAHFCYISTVNSAHFHQAHLALETGKHTVVDKPITMNREQSDALVNLSRKKKLLLSEAVVYLSHIRIRKTQERMRQSGYMPQKIDTAFCIPPLPEENFRYNPSLGGGVMMDMGAYIVTPGRIFFDSTPISLEAEVLEIRNTVPIELRVLMKYEGGRSVSGVFSLNGEYRNNVQITGKNFCIHMERFFTTPMDMETVSRVRSNGLLSEWDFPADDAFRSYLQHILSIDDEDTMENERRKIIDDQRALSSVYEALA